MIHVSIFIVLFQRWSPSTRTSFANYCIPTSYCSTLNQSCAKRCSRLRRCGYIFNFQPDLRRKITTLIEIRAHHLFCTSVCSFSIVKTIEAYSCSPSIVWLKGDTAELVAFYVYKPFRISPMYNLSSQLGLLWLLFFCICDPSPSKSLLLLWYSKVLQTPVCKKALKFELKRKLLLLHVIYT